LLARTQCALFAYIYIHAEARDSASMFSNQKQKAGAKGGCISGSIVGALTAFLLGGAVALAAAAAGLLGAVVGFFVGGAEKDEDDAFYKGMAHGAFIGLGMGYRFSQSNHPKSFCPRRGLSAPSLAPNSNPPESAMGRPPISNPLTEPSLRSRGNYVESKTACAMDFKKMACAMDKSGIMNGITKMAKSGNTCPGCGQSSTWCECGGGPWL